MVEPLLDAVGVLGPLDELFPDSPADAWAPYRERYPELFDGDSWRLLVVCFLVRSEGATVLVDTGAGPRGLWTEWEPEQQEGLLPELTRHGVEPADVDIVFLTHDHIDHVGWNSDGDRRPMFPRARYLLHEEALAASRATAADRPHISRCVLALENRIETIRDGDEIASGLTVVALPGHADGLCGLVVGEGAVIVADAVAHPAQLDHPGWTFAFDEDHERAIETRRRIVDDYGDAVLYLSHLPVGWRR